MGFGKIFRSRWSALFWAGGVLWTAYDVANAYAPPKATGDTAPAAVTDATGLSVSKANLDTLANAMGD